MAVTEVIILSIFIAITIIPAEALPSNHQLVCMDLYDKE